MIIPITRNLSRIIFYKHMHTLTNMSRSGNSCYVEFPDLELIQSKHELISKLISDLEKQGFCLNDNFTVMNSELDKEGIRSLHSHAIHENVKKNEKYLSRVEKNVFEFFANGDDISPKKMDIRIEEVVAGKTSGDLFNYATCLWSVPVSKGFGRRTRFLVWDSHNEKLVGLFALGDPVFNLKCRDTHIGWNARDREERLYNTMDAFVLGAVPPYNILLGGKLIAMVATSNEVRDIIKRKYVDKTTIIDKKNKDPTLAMITTSSALGKSSIYDRIKFENEMLYKSVGYSSGFGHFHISDGLFHKLTEVQEIENEGSTKKNRYGNGPNWKFRVIRKGLESIGLPSELIRHGIKREVYCVPLSKNYKEYLCGIDSEIDTIDMPLDKLFDEWKNRWLTKRSETRPDYINVKKESIKEVVWKNV